MRHLDIRKLLAEEERINVTFSGAAANLGFLDPQCHARDLPSQSKVLLPLWLGESLTGAALAEIEMPKYLNSKMREAIRAGPQAIDLRSFSFYFFETGRRLAALLDRSRLVELRIAFCGERYTKLMDLALSEDAEDDVSEFRQSLTAAEVTLFDAGLRATKDVRGWQQALGSGRKLTQAPVLGK